MQQKSSSMRTYSAGRRRWIGLVTIWMVVAGGFPAVKTAHLSGTFEVDEFFRFLHKFGFQKTEKHSQKDTEWDTFGYIYGNITSKVNFTVPVTLAVLDKRSFLEYYANRNDYDRDVACQRMFEKLDKIVYSRACNPHAEADYLRRIPCEKGKLCVDEDTRENVVPGSQFTFVISDPNVPRFWYVSMVACYQNVSTCQWHHYDYRKYHVEPPSIDFDITLVNGNPNRQTLSFFNPLLFHFSFDRQNTLEMYLIFFVVYLLMVPLQIYAVRLQKHPVTRLFTVSLVLEFVSVCLLLTHTIRYAMNGVGNEKLAIMGDIFDIFSRTSFMLILLLLAKGWAVTRLQISVSSWILLMVIWIPYCAIHVLLYIWNRTEVDIISDIDEYQTWPGWLVLACRSTMMLWFLWELRTTMKYEHSSQKLDFLLHFGASSLVWFIYLPIVAIIAVNVSPLWRYKLLLGITNSADCLAYCVMMGLLWPNRAGQYLLLTGTNFGGMDELDEFNEAPHIVHRDSDTLHSSNGDLAVDDYLDNEDDEIETLVLSTDDLLHTGNSYSVGSGSGGGSKPLTLHNGSAMNGGLGKGGRSFD
ncbi:integral membrane protein GPR180 [Anopheles moucheti]|uniref:integral membrane protein GPR180 n=1 Tax=Anopheles moucheti TaxID=186751 RepID=UPI0022F06D9B|nr:integral membrane protein GPR180 [Anopheles moucheti]